MPQAARRRRIAYMGSACGDPPSKNMLMREKKIMLPYLLASLRLLRGMVGLMKSVAVKNASTDTCAAQPGDFKGAAEQEQQLSSRGSPSDLLAYTARWAESSWQVQM